MKIRNLSEKDLVKELLYLFGNTQATATQKTLVEKLIEQFGVSQQMLLKDYLTTQERKCLFYAAQGYSVSETANLLDCENSTIKYYRQAILSKLKCMSIAQAVFQGMKQGYLPPPDD